MTSRTAYRTSKPTQFNGHYLRKGSTLDIGVSGYMGIVSHKEHSPELETLTRVTPCISSPILEGEGKMSTVSFSTCRGFCLPIIDGSILGDIC